MMEENRKKGLGIAAVILGAISILCCSCLGMGICFSVIGAIFSIICVARGTGVGKTLGIIGIILNGIGLLLNAYMILTFIMMIDWSNVNAEALNQVYQIDPNNEAEIEAWLQQFFKEDISQYISY